jgi:PAS domain S-box-containing protein
MRRKRILAMLRRSPRLLPAVLFCLAIAVMLVSLFNAMHTAFHEGIFQTTVVVSIEILILGLCTLVFFRLIWRAAAENRRRELRDAFKNSPSGFAIGSLEGNFIEINPAWCQITGYSAHELKQMQFQQITHPDDLEKESAFLQELIDNRRSSYRLKKRYIHKDGSIVWIDLHVALVRDKDNNPQYLIGIIEPTSAPETVKQEAYPYDHSNLLFRIQAQVMPLFAPA